MPYTAGTANLTVGPQIAAQGIQSSMSSLTDILSKIGMMHLQDQQGGAILNAFKQQGYFDDQPGKPNSAMMPAAIYNAAQKGPLGTKFALANTMQNYLQMNYQMRMNMARYGMEQGGYVNPQGQGAQSQGNQGGGQRPAPQQQPLYDRQNAPPTAAGGMNLTQPAQANPYAAPGGPQNSSDEVD